MNFYKKLGEIRPNQLITTYGPGSIMDAVNDSLTVLDIEYWDNNNIGKEIRDTRLASYMNVRKFFMPKTGGKEDIPVGHKPTGSSDRYTGLSGPLRACCSVCPICV